MSNSFLNFAGLEHKVASCIQSPQRLLHIHVKNMRINLGRLHRFMPKLSLDQTILKSCQQKNPRTPSLCLLRGYRFRRIFNQRGRNSKRSISTICRRRQSSDALL